MTKENEKVVEVKAKVEETQADVKTETAPSKSDGKDYAIENENLRKHISTLQKKIDEMANVQERFAKALIPEQQAPQVSPDDVLGKVEELKAEWEKSRKEIEKNNYIDSLDISDNRKRYLKNKVGIDNYEVQAQKELEELEKVIQAELASKPISDTRPVAKAIERGAFNTDSANDIDLTALKQQVGARR